MERELYLKFLESNMRLFGNRAYNIDFSSLDDISLQELVELFRNILSQLDISELKISNISNRCCHLCIERRQAGIEDSLDICFICGVVNDREEKCSFSNDYDAKHLCPQYHSER